MTTIEIPHAVSPAPPLWAFWDRLDQDRARQDADVLWNALEHQLSAQRITGWQKPGKRGKKAKVAAPVEVPATRERETETVHLPINEHGVYRGTRPAERVVDTVTAMFRRGHLSERQYSAALAYREAWEATYSGMPCALDQTRRGGGGQRTSPTPRQLWGGGRLNEAEQALGRIDARLVRLVCAEGLTVAEAAQEVFGKSGRAVEEHAGRRFRDGLDVLAGMWVRENRGTGEISGTGSIDQFDPAALGTDVEAAGNVMLATGSGWKPPQEVVAKGRRGTK